MSPTSHPISAATLAWWSYERPAEYDVVGTAVDVTVRDGITITCELRHPARDGVVVDGRFPSIVVEFTPYVVLRDFYVGEADFFASRGYNALVPLVRGIGGSGGTWDNGSFRTAGRDAHDVIEWLAAQPFADGRVGMYGESYGGQTSYSAAIEQPEHLVAIAPMQSPSSLFHDVIFPGGVKTTERGEIDSWPPIANITTAGAVDADAEFAANRAHPTFDEFWHDRSFVDVLAAVTIPVLAVGGWNDEYFRSGTIANIEALPGRTWAIYGPWGHFFPVSLSDEEVWSPGDSDGVRAAMLADRPQLPSGVLLAWFDHWVAGRADAPIPAEPTFTSFEGPPNVGAGWREIDAWDPSSATGVHLRLGADGSLGGDEGPVGALSFRQPSPIDDPIGAASFTSVPLTTDQVLTGHSVLSFRAALDAPEAYFYVELIDVGPDGDETRVNDGFLAASHRHSNVTSEPVIVGAGDDYRVPIRAHHHRFVEGHRVRVRVSGGPPSRVTPPPAPVTVTLEIDGASALFLPGFAVDR